MMSNPFLSCPCQSVLASLLLSFLVTFSTVVTVFSELDLCFLKEWAFYDIDLS